MPYLISTPDLISTIVIALVLCLAAVLAYAFSRPNTFHVARTVRIAAPPEKIFPLIDDLHAFNTWNPFLDHDPNVKLSYSGPASGKGAAHAWTGNGKVGAGTVEVVGSSPPERVTMDLHMLKPMEARNEVVFTLVPASGGTDVTWAMTGKSTFVSKLMCLVISMDSMVGGAFERGLAKLKRHVEG